MIIKALNKMDKYSARRICLVYVPAVFWTTAAVVAVVAVTLYLI